MNPVSYVWMGLGTLSVGLLSWSMVNFLFNYLKVKKTLFPPLKITDRINTPQKILTGGLLAGLMTALLSDLYLGLLTALIFVLAWILFQKAPEWKRKHDIDEKLAKMREIFPQTLGAALQALKTGQTIPQVLDYLSRESPQPLRGEWALVCAEMELGSSAEQALAKMGDIYPEFQEFHQFLESYKISRSTGANLTQLVQVHLEGMEEKNRILRKMEAMTAQARLSGLMVGFLPFLLGFVFFIMDPSLILPLFTEKIGLAILLIAGVLETIGFLWIRQLLQLEV